MELGGGGWSWVEVGARFSNALQKSHIYHTKQYQTFYRKIKCDLLNFRGSKKLVPSGFPVFDGFYSFFS